MLLDKGNHVVESLLRRLETTLSVGRNDELIAPDTPSVTVQTDIGRITQAVPSVQMVARIDQHVLNRQSVQKIVVGKFSFSHVFYLPLLMSLIS